MVNNDGLKDTTFRTQCELHTWWGSYCERNVVSFISTMMVFYTCCLFLLTFYVFRPLPVFFIAEINPNRGTLETRYVWYGYMTYRSLKLKMLFWIEQRRTCHFPLTKMSYEFLLLRIWSIRYEPTTDHFRYHFYLQLKKDILEGRLQVPRSTAALLASYAVQCKYQHRIWVF